MNTFDENQFRQRIIELRNKKNITARALSLRIGYNDSYINRIETGKMLPSWPVFIRICEELDITLMEFFHIDSKDEAYIILIMNILKELPVGYLAPLQQLMAELVKQERSHKEVIAATVFDGFYMGEEA